MSNVDFSTTINRVDNRKPAGGAKCPATYEDLLRVPEHQIAEILGGELIVSPRPASLHTLAATQLTSDLCSAFGGPPGTGAAPGGWWILFEPEIHFEPTKEGKNVLVPDLAGWRRERMPQFLDVPYFTLVPDWVCEVRSPSNTKNYMMRKMKVYARADVSHCWRIDPIVKTLQVFCLENQEWKLIAEHQANASVRAEPFAAVVLHMQKWWG